MNWYKKAQVDHKEELYLQSPDPIHNNWGLVLQSEDQNKLIEFIRFCRSLPKELHAFWQSGSHMSGDQYPSYQYFELWGAENKQDLVLNLAEKLSQLLNINLEIK